MAERRVEVERKSQQVKTKSKTKAKTKKHIQNNKKN